MHYAEGNEAPEIYHKWGALGLLSVLTSRRTWFDQKYYKVYPHIYVVYVGDPGVKKSTALNISREFAQAGKVPVAPPSITKETMTMLLSHDNEKSPFRTLITRQTEEGLFQEEIYQMALYASEIVTMLSAGGAPTNIIEFLTDIYDRDFFEVATKNKGTDVIKNPYITLLGGMTPEQTGNLLKQSIISGGFSRRCIFVYGKPRPEGVPFPEITPSQQEAKKFILSCIDKIREIRGEFVMNDEAKDYFISWYHAKHKRMLQPLPAAQKFWLQTKDTQALKVSILLGLSELDPTKTITLERLTRAIKLLDEVEPDLGKVFSGAGRNIGNELAEKMLVEINSSPNKAISRKELISVMFAHGNFNELNEALLYLVETSKVRKFQNPQNPAVEMLTTVGVK